MKNPLNLGNSIYQQKGNLGSAGLTVSDGMLINNRPNGETGIAQLARIKKATHKAEKISTYATAFAMGEKIEELGGGCGM